MRGLEMTTLVEREHELAALDATLAAARAGTGRLVVVDGPAGIGKTRLVRRAAGEAASAGMRVLRASGAELERELPWGCAVQLLAGPLAALPEAEREAVTGGAAAVAAELLRSGAAPAGGNPTLQLLHGLHWLCANLAERAPLLVAVDDVQDADAQTLRLLGYVAGRLDELPVALLVARRSGATATDPAALDALLARGERLAPRALSEAAVTGRVRAAIPVATDAFCAGCARFTAGNPLYLEALLSALRDDEIAADDAGAERLARLGAEAVSRAVLGRIAALGPDALQLAAAAAVLGGAAPLRATAALAEVAADAAPAAADRLVAADVLAAGEPLRFTHPIVREVVYEDLALPCAARRTCRR